VVTYAVTGGLNISPDGKNYFRGFATTWHGAENLKRRRATVAGPPPEGWKDAPADYALVLDPAFFEAASLLRVGK